LKKFYLDKGFLKPRIATQIKDCLTRGGVICYPTDSVYGIGCDIFQRRAIEKIHWIKKLKKNKLLSFICSDIKQMNEYVIISNQTFKLIKRLLPGPYTFILSATTLVPKIMLTKRRTVGVRIPDNDICLEIVKYLGNPLITASALSTDEIYSDPDEIENEIGANLDILLDAGVIPYQQSTVVDLTGNEPQIIREGIGDSSYFSR